MNMQAQLQAALDAATSAPTIDDTSPVAVPLTDPPNIQAERASIDSTGNVGIGTGNDDDDASSWKHVSEVIPQPQCGDWDGK